MKKEGVRYNYVGHNSILLFFVSRNSVICTWSIFVGLKPLGWQIVKDGKTILPSWNSISTYIKTFVGKPPMYWPIVRYCDRNMASSWAASPNYSLLSKPIELLHFKNKPWCGLWSKKWSFDSKSISPLNDKKKTWQWSKEPEKWQYENF